MHQPQETNKLTGWQETRYLLSTQANRDALTRSQEEAALGQWIHAETIFANTRLTMREPLYERLYFLSGHRVIHLGLRTTSRHRKVSKTFRPKRGYRFRQFRDGGLNWRYRCSPKYRGRVQ